MNYERNFLQAFKRLNPEQRQAVTKIDGPVMVVAGPGTGKTQVLATRIAHILRTEDVGPHNILALTFTDAAAHNMRERIVSLVGSGGFYANIMTFHGFAATVIAQYPEKFPIERGSQPLSDLEKFELFSELLTQSQLKLLKPIADPLHHITAVISAISELKREYIDPNQFETILHSEAERLEQDIVEYWEAQAEKARVSAAAGKTSRPKEHLSVVLTKRVRDLAKQKELHLIYTHYQSELIKRKRYDFDDMITFVVRAFESDSELLLDYQEQFQYILVDEYQDTNASQNRIVELLASYWEDTPSLFVVGDPHQSIFRFQGASMENMVRFIDRYPKTVIITLTTGYRCPQTLYDAAHELITHNKLTLAKSEFDAALSQCLTAAQGQGVPAIIYQAESQTLELLFIAEKIRLLIESGVLPEEIAVLYKNNKEAEAIREVLEKWRIPHELSVGTNVLDNLLIQQLLHFLQVMRAIVTGLDDGLIFEVLQYQWLGFDRTAVYKLARVSHELRCSIVTTLDYSYEQLPQNCALSEADFQTFCAWKKRVEEWHAIGANMLFHEWFSLLLARTPTLVGDRKDLQLPEGFGFMDYVLEQPIKTDHLYALNSLYGAIKQFVNQKRTFTLPDFLQTIATMKEHKVRMPIEDCVVTRGRVSLSTAHKSKGREWQHVFVMGCVNKKWGNTANRVTLTLPSSILRATDITDKEKNEDDRRLLYVALTRASKQLYITHPEVNAAGKQYAHSVFLTEIADYLQPLPEESIVALRQNSDALLEKLLVSESLSVKDISAAEQDFFAELVSRFKLSVTALNNYLKDPQEFLLNSLLKVPRAKTPNLAFGTAVHAALEHFFLNLQKNNILTEAELLAIFERALDAEYLSPLDCAERKKQGAEVLAFYYAEALRQPRPALFVERLFGSGTSKAILVDGEHEIQLSGRMDKVELLDSHARLVRVVDYKTGSPKTDGVIQGTASTAEYSERELALPLTIRGRYQRQMVFYKLLAELDKTFSYTVSSVALDFVEPGGSRKNTHAEREFTISEEAVADLRELIIMVMREIRELKFLHAR